MRLGKLPPQRPTGMPALGDFLDRATAWPTVPPEGWEYAIPASSLSVLGNDEWGDCAEAGALGLAQAQSYNAGRPLIPTTDDALALYSSLTGFNAAAGPSGDNPTDQGTVLTDLLTAWQRTGIEIGGVTHKIAGWASVDISSAIQLRYAAYTFGGLYIGLRLPSACQTAMNWNFGPGQDIDGGHCVVILGEGADGVHVRSWGEMIPATWEFLSAYMDEAHVVVSEDWIIAAKEKSPTGLDLDGLVAALARFGGAE